MNFLKKLLGLRTKENEKEKLIRKIIALEHLTRNQEGQSMEGVEMLAWKEILMRTPEETLSQILGDTDKLRAYVTAEMKGREPMDFLKDIVKMNLEGRHR